MLKRVYQKIITIRRKLQAIHDEKKMQVRTEISPQVMSQEDWNCHVGLSKDGKYATYELKFVQEIMHYLNEVDTDKSKELLRKMICPNPRKSDMSEEESRLRSMTRAERNTMLYGASLPKDSETLQILRKLDGSVKSENCK